MATSLQQFIHNLSQTGLLSAGDVATLCDRLPVAERPADAEALAKLLIRQGKLTKYQAQAVYSGKHQNLVFGEYVVLDKLGAGGMGVVLKAQHRRMKRLVAIKVLPAATMKNQVAVDRFFREVEAAAKLIHPNIVAAFDAGEHQGMHYLVMEFVDGRDLAAIAAERGPLPVEQAIEYVLQAARGLEFAHARGVVHRDIKPANLLLSSEGQVKILDMGLARLSDSPGLADVTAAAQLTQSGQVMGTVDYMAPEQAMDTHSADHRADIYALGCTLYRLLTAHALYDGDTMVKKLMAHQQAPVPSLRAARPDVPEALDDIFQQMVAKRPEDRYQSMTEVIAALQEVGSAVRMGGTSQSMDAMGVGGASSIGGSPRPSHPATGRATPSASSSVRTADPTGEAPTLALSGATVDTDPQTQTTMAAAIAEAAKTSARRINRRFGRKTLIAGLGFLILAAAAAYIIRVQTNVGEVVIECEEPGVEISIARNGEPVKGMALEKTETTERIGAGDVVVTVKGSRANEFKVTQETTTLLRNGRVVARIKMIAKEKKVADSSSSKPLAAGTKAGDEWSGNGLAMKFCWCPSGEFKMGSPKEEPNRQPNEDQVDVKLTRGFWLGKYEVTQAEYQRVMKKNPSQFSATGPGKDLVKGLNTEVLPVEFVSWDNATEYCRMLTEHEQEDGRLPAGWEYTLPTEAQWEYACRAGTSTAYSFGNAASRLSDCAWYDANSEKRTHEVGQKPPNPWGLHDMHGNVWEWCRDSVQEKLPGGANPEVTEKTSGRVLRGGGWELDGSRCRSAYRGSSGQHIGINYFGFRVALVQSKPLAEGTRAGDEWSGNGLAMKFCWCPPGEFKMGEAPNQVDVNLTRGFWLGQCEVTQAAYGQVMNATPSHFSRMGEGKALVDMMDTANFPVEMVCWDDADAFCRKLSAQERAAGRLPAGWEYRLPTEAQWEYACRSGTTTDQSFGNQESEVANYARYEANSGKRPHPVGSRRANPWGLYDTYGNVSEWCRDWHHEKLPGGADPELTERLSGRVIRGGGWDSASRYCRSGSRSGRAPALRDYRLGFRLALVQSTDPIDILAQVRLPDDEINRERYSGGWKRDGTTLVSPGGLRQGLIVTKIQPPTEYELTAVVQRVSGSDGLHFGVVVDGHACCVQFDVYGEKQSGITLLDGKEILENESRVKGAVLPGLQQRTIRIAVGKRSIRATIDDKEIIRWEGDPARLTPPGWVTQPKNIWIATAYDQWKFHKLELRPLSGATPSTGPAKTPPAGVPSPGGFALEFDGRASYVEVPTLSRDAHGPLTIEAYVRLSANTGNIVVRLEGKAPCQLYGWPKEGNLWVPNNLDDRGKFASGTPPMEVGRRHHLAMQLDERSAQLFIDGKKVNAEDRAAGEAKGVLRGMLIGAATKGDGKTAPNAIAATLDEIRISKVLRYKQDFAPQGPFQPDADTLALYHCDEGQGDVLKDASVNNHHGKIVGAKWVRAQVTGSPAKLSAGDRLGQEWSSNGLVMKFCWCPPGDFKMGERKDAVDVKLTRGFWLGQCEVTQAEYGQVMNAAPSHFSKTGGGKALVNMMDTANFPVEMVCWDEAAAFCRKLGEQERAAGRLPADWEYRLPTEAQWEYACRAGTTTAYCFGDAESQLENVAWYEKNSQKRTHEVRRGMANNWKLHDMHGNVWEWCQDWHTEKLPGGTDPAVAAQGTSRVFRGGCWDNIGQNCRSAFRNGHSSDYRVNTLGFRVALVPTAIDVLLLIDPAKHASGEGARREGTEIVAGYRSDVTLPVDAPGGFQLRAAFTVTDGPKLLNLTFPLGDRLVDMALHAADNETGYVGAGLNGLDGRNSADAQNPTHAKVPVVATGKRHTLLLTATRSAGQATIRALVDDKPFIDWTGPATRLGAAGAGGPVKITFKVYKGQLRLHSLDFVPLNP